MAIIRKKELATMSVEEAKEKLKELRLELLRERAQKVKAKRIRELRRTIAALLFIIRKNEREVKKKQ